MTSSGVEASNGLSLTRDGKQLAFSGKREGKWDLWEKSLVDSREAPIVADDYNRLDPQWSPDGTRLAYFRETRGEHQVMVWSPQSRSEEPFRVTTFETPALMLPEQVQIVELSLTQDKLVLTVEKRSGSIWVLDNVGP